MAGISSTQPSGERGVIYSGFRGVDLRHRHGEGGRNRLAYAKNVYIDYEGDGGGAIESIPGYRWLCSLGMQIKGIYLKRGGDDTFVYIHAGNTLYRTTLNELNKGKAPVALVGFGGETSTSVSFGQDSFFLDGQKLIHVRNDSTVRTVAGNYERVYIPTTYVNGERLEQGNLLTRSCYESYYIGAADSVAYETRGLQFRIISEESKTVAITGISDGTVSDLYIPSSVAMLGEKYIVYEIDDYAFYQNTALTNVYISNGVNRIGRFAFSQCTSLLSVITPDSLVTIDNGCFARDTSLSYLHLGAGITTIGSATTSLCTSLTSVTYAGSESDFSALTEMESFTGAEVTFDHRYRKMRACLPIYGPAVKVNAVKIDGISYSFTTEEDGRLSRLIIELNDKRVIEGKEAVIELTYSSNSALFKDHGGAVSLEYFDYAYCDNVIFGCRKMVTYDRRIFAGGNPMCPGVVFFTSRDKSGNINPLYFGENDYFDSRECGEVVELFPTSDSLAIFSRAADGEVSVNYYAGKDTGDNLIPRAYPNVFSHRGLRACYGCEAFFDDYVFLSQNGLVGIDRREINLPRFISSRSDNVNSYLLKEDLSRASMTVWCGYLIISVDGRMYLADSRGRYENEDGSLEYEWFYLDGIGSFPGDTAVYRYQDFAFGDFKVKAGYENEAVAPELAVSVAPYEDGHRYYTSEDGVLYHVYATEQRRGGSFSPACAVASDGEHLIFGTESGDILIFNNDMRGVPPMPLYLSSGFDESQYRRAFGARIDPAYYSFAGHAVEYAITTASDDLGHPNAEKSTVKGTLSVKCNTLTRGLVTVGAEANGGAFTEICTFPSSCFCFDGVDFSTLTFSSDEVYTRAFSEKLKRWVEKSVTVSSREFCSPISVHSIAYRARVSGKIKNR
ncbi:MAG: leucine-rich repeat domain-containing protein [Clostridia bacterium]|nr:leucine-rich repeat domain-containing protein [Clostridia bacterium]